MKTRLTCTYVPVPRRVNSYIRVRMIRNRRIIYVVSVQISDGGNMVGERIIRTVHVSYDNCIISDVT